MVSPLTDLEELVRKYLHYQDGVLYWKVTPGGGKKAGDKAGYTHPSGYMQTMLKGKSYYNHVLIFLLHHGYIPEEVDHIDNDPTNNWVDNLRPCTRSQNQSNKRLQSNNTSGIKGVGWCKRRRKWFARISKDKRRYTLGFFTSIEEASVVLSAARTEMHGEFANH